MLFRSPKLLVCPSDTLMPAASFARLIAPTNHSSYVGNLKLSVGDLGKPTSILATDRNLSPASWACYDRQLSTFDPGRFKWGPDLHRLAGNILFANGHVDFLKNGPQLISAVSQWQIAARTDRPFMPFREPLRPTGLGPGPKNGGTGASAALPDNTSTNSTPPGPVARKAPSVGFAQAPLTSTFSDATEAPPPTEAAHGTHECAAGSGRRGGGGCHDVGNIRRATGRVLDQVHRALLSGFVAAGVALSRVQALAMAGSPARTAQIWTNNQVLVGQMGAMKLLGSKVKEDRRQTRRGFTLFEVLIILAILGLLAAAFLPALTKSRHQRSRIDHCSNNLKQVGLAVRMWALDNNDLFPMQVSVTNGGTMELVDSGNVYVHFLVMSNELHTPKLLICPQDADPKRLMATTFSSTVRAGLPDQIPFTNDHSVSYFVGVEADELQPQAILSGDANLALGGVPVSRGMLNLWTNAPVSWTKDRHVTYGNIGLADGSVQPLSDWRLPHLLRETGRATNRLAFP